MREGVLVLLVLVIAVIALAIAATRPGRQRISNEMGSGMSISNLFDTETESVGGTAIRKDDVSLRYFRASEFGRWWDKMSVELLYKLDEFRHRWGDRVIISSDDDAIGRTDGSDSSQHNVNTWGEVRAIDVFPKVGIGYIKSAQDRARAFKIARDVGFTGIGLYTDTKPGNMLHVDVRESHQEGNPALWSRVNHEYGSIYEVV